eukprot:4601872-Amphidinium_carterae.1
MVFGGFPGREFSQVSDHGRKRMRILSQEDRCHAMPWGFHATLDTPKPRKEEEYNRTQRIQRKNRAQ